MKFKTLKEKVEFLEDALGKYRLVGDSLLWKQKLRKNWEEDVGALGSEVELDTDDKIFTMLKSLSEKLEGYPYMGENKGKDQI